MANPHGTPVWYELMTPDPDGAKAFYDPLVGWTIGEAPPEGAMDYRMIVRADGGNAGGVLRMTDDMAEHGSKPMWLFYVGVDDVDVSAQKAIELGGKVLLPPHDLEGVGRFALMADPDGAPFYLMRGASDESADVFDEMAEPGRCSWNELSSHGATQAIGFYGALFGWENRETMDMGPMGGYHFLHLGETRLGALTAQPQQPAMWTFYFAVPSIGAAVERAKAGGGTILMGPMEVPGGQHIIMGTDPQGARFALVGGA